MYKYELWYEHNCISENSEFDTEEDAIEDANNAKESIIEMWKMDGFVDFILRRYQIV